MIKYCKTCGKELTKEQSRNIYCSSMCSQLDRRNQKIQEWKDGTFDGLCGKYQISDWIRNYLLEKHNYSCELCGWNKINPTTGKVPLDIHHIDGDYRNNKEENLQVLCPNCHSLTPNYKALNKTERKTSAPRKNFCIDCGKEITGKSIRCCDCNGKAHRTEKPVTRDELKELIRTLPFTKIGDKFGVTDNAVRKWCDTFNLPRTKEEITAYSDEQWKLI